MSTSHREEEQYVDLTPPEILIEARNASDSLLPPKSREKYLAAYETFIQWKNNKNTQSFSENVFLAYFNELANKYKPSSLWCIYSMLKSTVKTKNDIDIKTYCKLTAFLKRRSDGYNGRKSKVLSTTDVEKFIKEAPDSQYLATKSKNGTTTEVPIARSGKDKGRNRDRSGPKNPHFDIYDPGQKDWESGYVEMPKDLYQAHLRPGVIFRIHMSEAVLKMQYRNYGEDKDESVIEADVEYLRLTRKVINDEITKFEDLQWLIGWFHNRSDLIQEHMCNTRYYAVGTPPTMFTHPEEYMKRTCLFDSVYIDHIPYVVGEDSSIMAAVAPPVLHCDAATCTSVPFIDSVMFDEHLSRTNVRTVTRCQASCRAHCRNDPDCLKRCSDRCLRSD